MEKLTIEDVIEHCDRQCERYEKFSKHIENFQDYLLENNKYYVEHYYVKEWLKELQRYKKFEEQGLLLREEDVLKFYYCESEDKYLVGQRVGTMYYAEVGKTGLCFIMSRYLPWGEHVVAPHTVWKEHTYPSEPKEIPFFDWLQWYIKQLNSKAEKTFAEMEK